MQAPLYMCALLEQGLEVKQGRYRAIRKPGDPKNGAQVTVGNAKYESALRIGFSIPARVRAGLFEPVLAAKAGNWRPWDPGAEVTRSRAKLPEGNRFETSPRADEGAGADG